MSSGILLLDKPQGWTSHDVVARTRRLAGTRKVGHAGTLDPMATGLLLLGIDSATRLLTYMVGLDKEYFATIRLGASTTTDDAEGETIESAPPASIAAITAAAIDEQLAQLRGDIEQVPSTVSAIKVDGKRAYALARAGEEVVLKKRPVTVSAFELLGDERADGFLDLRVRVECSSGTYIRALARDLGSALGVGGHLTALRRTRIGPFRVEDAHQLETVVVAESAMSPADAASALFEVLQLNDQQALELGQGKRPEFPDRHGGPFAAIDMAGRLVGLADVRGGKARVLVNFPVDQVATATAAPSEGTETAQTPEVTA